MACVKVLEIFMKHIAAGLQRPGPSPLFPECPGLDENGPNPGLGGLGASQRQASSDSSLSLAVPLIQLRVEVPGRLCTTYRRPSFGGVWPRSRRPLSSLGDSPCRPLSASGQGSFGGVVGPPPPPRPGPWGRPWGSFWRRDRVVQTLASRRGREETNQGTNQDASTRHARRKLQKLYR